MTWTKIEIPPKDDETVFVVHEQVQMLPHKAYYDGVIKQFISLESRTLLPICCTHWMKMPPHPSKQQPKNVCF